ncbi:MAG: hypothetical protein IKL44_06355 [Clostridia bacterium]|nr:hypothetical protein [Clostridia bacterium]
MNVTGIVALCLLGGALCVLLRSYGAEYSLATALIIGVLVLLMVIRETAPFFERLSDLLSKTELDSGYFKMALKAIGICYITSFAADLCRDFGQSSLAAKAELAGKCGVFLVCFPMIEAVIETALSFVGEI